MKIASTVSDGRGGVVILPSTLPPSFSGHQKPALSRKGSIWYVTYGLLRVQVTAAVYMTGLDPYIGYLHEVSRGQPAIVLDLMEEFRPLVTDSLVLTMLHKREVQPEDFTESLGAYRLSTEVSFSGWENRIGAWALGMA